MSKVVVEMTADEAGLFRAMGRIVGQQRKMEDGFGKIKNKSKDAGRASDDAFGSKALGQLKGFAAGFFSLSTAVGMVTSALQKMSQARNDASQRLSDAFPDLGELAQLAENPDALIANARHIFRSGGAPTLGQAAQLEFALQSAGEADFRETAIGIGRTGLFGDVPRLMESAGAVRAAFTEKESGDFEAIISKGLGGGSIATGKVDQLLFGVSRASATAAQLGLSDEEAIAATSALSVPLGSSEVAGTFLNSLLTSLAEQGGFEGQSLKQMLAKVSSQKMDFPQLKEAFGRTEAIKALDVLTRNGDLYDQALSQVNEAQANQALRRRLAGAETSEVLGPEIRARERKQRVQDIEFDFARMEKLADEATAEAKESIYQEFGKGPLGTFMGGLTELGDDAVRSIVGGEGLLRMMDSLGLESEVKDPDLRREIQEALRERDRPTVPRPQLNEGAAIGAQLNALNQIASILSDIRGNMNGGRIPAVPSSRAAQIAERNAEVS